MTRAMTSPELAALRTDGQRTKLYLAVLKPNTVYSAVLASVPAANDMVGVIAYSGGSGTLADVKVGMTLYVGTGAGAFDLGMCRIRKAPDAGAFYIGETSEIKWNVGGTIHLTIVDDFDLWERPLHVANDGSLKADYDIAYSDQHLNFDPVPVMGPHAVVWLTGASVDVTFDASGSWVIGSSISGHAWSAPGASGSSGMATATPTMSYDMPGVYRVFDTVTAANGKSFTGVRYVFVYSAASMPATVFQLKNLAVDHETGGWSFGMLMHDEASLGEIRERALVILFARDWHGEVEGSYGPVAGRENIVMVGRVAGESIQWDADAGTVEFSVQGPQYWLRRIAANAAPLVQVVGNPSAWNQVQSLTVRKALFHILHWRSTATKVMDVRLTSDARLTLKTESPAPNVWDQVAEIAWRYIFARPGCNRYGQFWCEIEPQLVPVANRTWPTVMTITEDDWEGTIGMRRSRVGEASQVNLSGQLCDASGSEITLYSLSMGHVHTRYGRPEILDRVLVSSQAQSNSLAGLVMGWRNNQLPEIPIKFAGGNRFIDLWPRQFCAIAIAAGDNERGVAYSGNLVPRSISFAHDEALTPEVLFEAETFEQLAIDGDIPETNNQPTELPPPDFPPPIPPPVPSLGPPDDISYGPKYMLMATSNFGILYTDNFNEADGGDVDWKFMNNGLTTFERNNVLRIKRCPSGLILIAVKHPTDLSIASIYYATALGGSWNLLIDYTQVDQGSYDVPVISAFGVNPNKTEEIMIVGGGFSGLNIGTKKIYMGDRNGVSLVTGDLDIANHPGDVSYGIGKWILVISRSSALDPAGWSRFSASGSIEVATLDFETNFLYQGRIFHQRRAGKVYVINNNVGDKLRIMANNTSPAGEVIRTLPYNFDVYFGRLAISPSGQYMIGGPPSVIGQRSSDEGASWGNIGGSMSTGYGVWENCESEDAFVTATSQVVKYTPDWGDTWISKSGNLPTLAPLCVPVLLKHIAWE